MLILPLARASRFVLVRPHYPENVGAVARAMKTMGLTQLVLVRPGRLALPEHENAFKMAVRAWDVLGKARVCDDLAEAIDGCQLTFGTTSRRGVSGVLQPREAAALAARHVATTEHPALAFLFGNEKTGLDQDETSSCDQHVRIPMAADQPSINLAQATQILAYELFLAGLEARQPSA